METNVTDKKKKNIERAKKTGLILTGATSGIIFAFFYIIEQFFCLDMFIDKGFFIPGFILWLICLPVILLVRLIEYGWKILKFFLDLVF